MDLFSAERQAKLLMAAHGLVGWKFEWDSAKRRFGQCNHTDKIISLSQVLTVQLPEASIRDTMLHEIAHALVGPGHGHDAVWRRKALQIGSNGQRCGSEKVELSYKWRGVCPRGIHVYKRHRVNFKKRLSCTACSPNWNENHIIRWTAAY